MAERWGDAVLRPRRPQGGETRYAATVVRRDLPLGRETLAWKTAAGGLIVTVLWLVRGRGGGGGFSFRSEFGFLQPQEFFPFGLLPSGYRIAKAASMAVRDVRLNGAIIGDFVIVSDDGNEIEPSFKELMDKYY